MACFNISIILQEFAVYITPVTMTLELYNEMKMTQGDTEAIITNRTLALETNGNRSLVFYNVTQPPGYGELMIDYESVMSFSQTDVDEGRLFYFQLNLESAFDEFKLDVRDAVQNEIVGVEVAIIVEPLVSITDGVISVSGDGPFQITVDVLDASELASITNSDPVYEVVRLPRLGTLSVTSDTGRRRRRQSATNWQRRRWKRTNGENEEEDELQEGFSDIKLAFSHDDVANNRVAYTPNPNAAPGEDADGPQEDGFNYILRASNAQPAVGSLTFEVTLPPATEAPPPIIEDDEYHYVYVDDVEDGEENGSEYVTTALIVAGGALTSICSIISYRCYRLSRRRRRKRRQRELEALQQDGEKTETVKRHAADLHPSEPLLTRSAWTEPMHVAASEGELRRIRAEHWLTRRQSRQRLNDALRCAGVDSNADDQQQGSPGNQDQTGDSVLSRCQSPQNVQSPYNSNRMGDDVTPQSARLQSFSTAQPYPRSRDDPAETQTLDRQRRSGPTESPPVSQNESTTRQPDTSPTRSGKLLPWFDRQPDTTSHPAHDDTEPRSTAARLPGRPLDTASTERYPDNRHTSPFDPNSTQRQNPYQYLDRSSVLTPVGPPDAAQLTSQRFAAPRDIRGAPEGNRDDACADGVHCDDVIAPTTRPGVSVTPLAGDDDGGYVTGSRPPRQPDDTGPHSAPAQQVVYDWDKVDPQLLDLCRKTSPVLDKNQYWV